MKHNWRFKNETGNRFGMLSVVQYAGKGKENRATWLCKCDCGKSKTVSGKELRNGSTKSCGCLYRWMITTGTHTRTHGHASKNNPTPEYIAWAGAKYRCTVRTSSGFKNYGGRGIKMCDRWINSFENFLDDMGLCPPGMMLDRKNNDGDYTPTNCRWATRTVQNNNKRNNHKLSFRGEVKTIADWSAITGISQRTIWKRLHRGWSLEKTLHA